MSSASCYSLPDPENRDGKWMVSKDVMDFILKILNLKFSIFINEVGIIVQVLPARLNQIIRHYSNMTQGDPMMPPYLPDVDPVMYTSLHTSHFICACRCFWYGAQGSEAVKAKGSWPKSAGSTRGFRQDRFACIHSSGSVPSGVLDARIHAGRSMHAPNGAMSVCKSAESLAPAAQNVGPLPLPARDSLAWGSAVVGP